MWLSIPFYGSPLATEDGEECAPAPLLYSTRDVCDCNNQDNKLGKFGEHFLAKCNKASSKNAMHATTQSFLNRCRKQAGINGGIEVHTDPNQNFRDGDVAFLGKVFQDVQKYTHAKVAVDIQVSHPSSARLSSVSQGSSSRPSVEYSRSHPFMAGNAGYTAKRTAVTLTRCNNNGFDFIPFSLETTGALHPEAVTLLTDLAIKANEKLSFQRKDGHDYILRRWRYTLSVELRKTHARTILDRISALGIHPQGRYFNLPSSLELFSESPSESAD